jgi:phosphoribosylformylglycinamidine cyclo-ligase
MYQVFNMGHRMELYVPAPCAAEIIAIARRFNLDAQQIGEVRSAPTAANLVTIEHGTEQFDYTL